MTRGYRKDGGIDLRRLPRIIFRPLGRHKALGLAWHKAFGPINDTKPAEPTIEIDSMLTNREKLDTILHESIHLACPSMSEQDVASLGSYLARVLWHLDYRQPE